MSGGLSGISLPVGAAGFRSGAPHDPAEKPQEAGAMALVKLASIAQRIESAIVMLMHPVVAGQQAQGNVRPTPEHWAAFISTNMLTGDRVASALEAEVGHYETVVAHNDNIEGDDMNNENEPNEAEAAEPAPDQESLSVEEATDEGEAADLDAVEEDSDEDELDDEDDEDEA